jgi:hypothetical protein
LGHIPGVGQGLVAVFRAVNGYENVFKHGLPHFFCRDTLIQTVPQL